MAWLLLDSSPIVVSRRVERRRSIAPAHTHLVPHMRNPVTAACHSFGLETIFKDYLSTRHQFAWKRQTYINWEDVGLANWKNPTKRWEFRRKEVLWKDRNKKIREKRIYWTFFVSPLLPNHFLPKMYFWDVAKHIKMLALVNMNCWINKFCVDNCHWIYIELKLCPIPGFSLFKLLSRPI